MLLFCEKLALLDCVAAPCDLWSALYHDAPEGSFLLMDACGTLGVVPQFVELWFQGIALDTADYPNGVCLGD